MIIALAPLLVAIVGALLYALTDGKLSELGRIAFFVGLLVTVWAMAGKVVHLP